MQKLKELLLTFVKPLVLAHLKDLTLLAPVLSKTLQEKSHMSPLQADALASDLIVVLEHELEVLINKI